ncbi:MAG TPA: HAD hydrolase-like protein [Dokdonella sp.]
MSEMPPVRAVLFDLDGTLVQTRESSWALFERTNREFALGIDTREQFFALFHENMFVALQRLVADPQRSAAAVEHFLDLLRAEYAPPLVPGIADVVRRLAQFLVLGIISTNSVEVIGRIVENAGLEHCFAHIFGGDIEPDKREGIRKFLRDPSYATLRTGSHAYQESRPRRLEPAELVLVTDTVGDARHGRECGVRVLGVSWGMHDPKALLGAGAEKILRWPQELVSWCAPSIKAVHGKGAFRMEVQDGPLGAETAPADRSDE